MAFRADEARQTGFESVVNYFIRSLDDSQKSRSRDALEDIFDKYGPAVDSYPTWHPLVCHHDEHQPQTTPSTVTAVIKDLITQDILPTLSSLALMEMVRRS